MNDSCSDTNAVNYSYWRLEGDCANNGVITAFFLMVIISIGLPWNILIIVTIIKEKLYHQPTIILLLNLAVGDLYLLLYPMLLVMITGYSREFIFGPSDRGRCISCHIITVCLITALYSSLFIVAAMSVDRLLYISKPLQYDRLAKPKIMWVVVVAIGSICTAIGLGILSSGFHGEFLNDYLICISQIRIPYLSILIAIGSFTVIVTLICNIWFFVIVLKNIKAVYGDKDDLDSSPNLMIWACCKVKVDTTAHHKQKRLFLVVGALILSTMSTWIPFVIILRRAYQDSMNGCSGREFITTVFVYSQSILHPIIETLLIPDVRKPLIKMVTCSGGQKTAELT